MHAILSAELSGREWTHVLPVADDILHSKVVECASKTPYAGFLNPFHASSYEHLQKSQNLYKLS
jgi:hypothetical protein